MVEDVEQKTEKAVAECFERSEVQTEHVRLDKRLGGVEESLKAITSQLEPLLRQLAVHDKNTQGFSGRCDENAPGVSLVEALQGSVEEGQMKPRRGSSCLQWRWSGCRWRWQGTLFCL